MAVRDWTAKLLCILLVQATVIHSCGPGLGTVGSGIPIGNPRFTFSVSPPLRWTYHTSRGDGQSADAPTAQRALEQDVNAAIMNAMYAANIIGTYTSTAQLTPAPNIQGPSVINGVDPCGPTTGRTADHGCTVGDTMMATSPAAGGTVTPYILTLNVEIDTQLRLTEAQWTQIGNQVLATLAVTSKAFPRSMVQVSGN